MFAGLLAGVLGGKKAADPSLATGNTNSNAAIAKTLQNKEYRLAQEKNAKPAGLFGALFGKKKLSPQQEQGKVHMWAQAKKNENTKLVANYGGGAYVKPAGTRSHKQRRSKMRKMTRRRKNH